MRRDFGAQHGLKLLASCAILILKLLLFSCHVSRSVAPFHLRIVFRISLPLGLGVELEIRHALSWNLLATVCLFINSNHSTS